jgi:hypothetical protein
MTLRYSAAVRLERRRYAAAAEDRQRRRAGVMRLVAAGELKVAEAADMLGVSDRTIWRDCKAACVNPKQARRVLLARLAEHAADFAPCFDEFMRERNPTAESNP